MASSPPRKFVGSCGWFEINETERTTVERAILRDADSLLVECEYERRKYSLNLKRKHGRNFEGGCTVQSGRDTWLVTVECKLLADGEDAIVFGRWKEEGEGYYWWAQLEQVEHFDDEQ
ncbi:MAG: hypothetical protein ACT4PS_06725 [Betaproteobacteria bacterium]